MGFSNLALGAVRVALLSVAAFALPSCGSDSEAKGGPSGATCPTDSTLTYETFGKGFMEDYCTRCHSSVLSGDARNGAPSDHNFDSLVEIQATPAEHIDEQAAAGPDRVNTTMPPSSPRPTEEERRQLGEWLACGTP